MSARKRARTSETNGNHHLPETHNSVSSSILSELLSRVSQLEESQNQVSELQTRVAVLEARVTELEREAIRSEDRDFVVGRSASRTILAIRDGKTRIVAERLQRGADPNHDDGIGGTCLIHAVGRGRPECTRLLIEHGADVSYCFPLDNASVLYMLVRSFEDWTENGYREGDYILAADLLVEAGAPIDEVQDEARTALSVLQEIEAREGTRRFRERRGLMAVLERRYWLKYGHNPFLRASSADAAAWLLLQGAADNDTGRVDITRVRSIKPDDRNNVLKSLVRYQGMRDTFLQIILTMRDASSDSPFCALRGHESTILPVIAAFAGSTGWSLQKLVDAKKVLQDVIERFNVDGGSEDGLYGDLDDEGDDDSYDVDDDDNDDGSRDERDEEHLDALVDTDDDGDY
jgi:hypothetical protein